MTTLKNREGKPFTLKDAEELSKYRSYTDYMNKKLPHPTRLDRLNKTINILINDWRKK